MNEQNPPSREELLTAAREAPPKVQLEEHREAVETLRTKGYSWREVAEFLTERGVITDHTRVYRHFAAPNKERRHTEKKAVQVGRVTFVGKKPTKKKNGSWNVVEIELPSKLGPALTVRGFCWGPDIEHYAVEADGSVSLRDATLVTRSGNGGFPMAYLSTEVRSDRGDWTPREIYIVPKWEAIL